MPTPLDNLNLSQRSTTDCTAIASNRINWTQECTAAISTFLTIAYVIIVNPLILSASGMPLESIFYATCIMTACACFAMGFWAKMPIVVGPSMALNGYFISHLVPLYHSWQAALMCVALSGLLLVLLSYTKYPQRIIEALPKPLVKATMGGIGLLMMTVAIQSANIGMPGLHTAFNTQALTGFAFTLLCMRIFQHYHIPGAGVLSILLCTLLFALYWPATQHPTLHFNTAAWGQIHLAHPMQTVLQAAVLSLLVMFDSTSTLHALKETHPQLNTPAFQSKQQRTVRITGATTLLGALLGLSNMGVYFESAAGLTAGARTGISTCIVGLCILLCCALAPYLSWIPVASPAAILFLIAWNITQQLRTLEWTDVRQTLPVIITALSIPLLKTIADGIGLGLLSYVFLNYKQHTISKQTGILTIVFLAYFILRLITLGSTH